MRTTAKLSVAVALLTIASLPAVAQEGGWGSVSFGLQAGFSKLEGDLEHPRLCPTIGGQVEYAPVPYFGLRAAASYAILNSRDYAERAALQWDKTIALPVEGEMVFRLFPLKSVTPYASIGAGALYWRSTQAGTGTIRKGWDAFGKVGGGAQFHLSKTLALSIGADVRV
ncbi:MAG: outer membrane beta-barrel protein, partial [Calditrichaeota bacterium]|nr:outer membrane beta-barrel protein [Calditrichota bacterium]